MAIEEIINKNKDNISNINNLLFEEVKDIENNNIILNMVNQ